MRRAIAPASVSALAAVGVAVSLGAGCGSSKGGSGGGYASTAAPTTSAATPTSTGPGSTPGSTTPGSTTPGSTTPGSIALATSGVPVLFANVQGLGPGFSPSDDPSAYTVDTTVDYDATIAPVQWVVPSVALPPQIQHTASNNCIGLCFHQGLLFLGWRTNDFHFASTNAKMYVVSSADLGQTWNLELEVNLQSDVREPSFVSMNGRLFFRFFQAGTDPLAFQPQHLYRCERLGPAQWSPLVTWGDPGEIAWDVKVRGGKAYQTSYIGNHYAAGMGTIDLRFRVSSDGIDWQPIDPAKPTEYTGGDSESAFEFDETGGLWAVTRDEDGDASGFGSHFATATSAAPGDWVFNAATDPYRYDSPKMFRHGKDLYLVARRNPNGPYDLGYNFLPFDVRKDLYLGVYSCSPKRTALYSIDRAAKRVVWIQDLPGDGDTAFPAVWRLDAHTFLVANYTSPLGNPDRWWIHGQVSPEGTQIYFTTITFKKR
jgi:hypothetical protein